MYLSSTLRKYVPDYDPQNGLDFPAGKGISISGLCELLGIPVEMVSIAIVNGKDAPIDLELEGNERVALFPPVGGG